MGFTPLEGLVMATRAGSVDPGLVLWLITDAGLTADAVRRGLERSSGLAGLAGTSDMRQLLDRRRAGDHDARLAFDVYVHALCRHIGAMTASLGGLDVLVFTGGVGEHAPEVRAAAADRLAYLGVAIDATRNAAAIGEGDYDVTASGARVTTVVVEAREDLEIARQTEAALAG
jgi:acetate kinase